jgi:large repetitive protein
LWTPVASEGMCLVGERAHDRVGPGSVASELGNRVGVRVGALMALIGVALVVLLFGAGRAEAVPSITFECTPAPADCSGWYRSNVSIDWTVLPSTAVVVAGCQDKTLSTDTAGTSEFCSARDGSTATLEVPIKIDKTRPVVLSGQPGRGADVNGWYNHAVGISFSGSDQTSGIDFCTSTTYSGPDSGAASLSGTCTDKAGNVSSPLGYGLKYDQTAPVVGGASPERAPNAAGWFNRAVRFDLQGSDATSGIADCPSVTYNGPNSATASFTGTCRDRAGNLANRTFGLKYDSTAPTGVSGLARRGPDKNGWYNRAIGIDFGGADQLSGIAGCTSTTYDGADGAAISVPGSCTDTAGNVSSSTFALKYDDTLPVVARGDPGREADVNGWYNRPVAITFTGSDLTSGIDSCTAPTYAGPDSATASLTGTCTDLAGNVGSPLGYGLKYDGTAPTVSGAAPERAANSDGWYNRPVRFDLQASDSASGIESCPAVTYSGPDSATASFTASCRDAAGNTARPSFGLKFDSTAPTGVSGLAARGPDKNGWYNRSVAIDFGGADTLSGIAACTRTTYDGADGAAISVPGTCIDRAGNSTPSTFGLKYDDTRPVVSGGVPGRAADVDGWYNDPVAIAFGGSDATSQIDTCLTTTYAGPDSGSASLSGACTDKAGNVSTPFPYGLKYDATAPAVSGANPERAPNSAGWFNQPVRFDLQASDETSGVGDCPSVTYSGPDSATASIATSCRDRAGNSTSRSFGLKYDATRPVVERANPDRGPNANGWFNRPVRFDLQASDATSGIDSCPPVTYSGPDSATASFTGSCRDLAGNSASSPFEFRYDQTAPEATGATPEPQPNEAGWHNSPVTVTFRGSDVTSGVEACTKQSYAGPDRADAAVVGTCTDKAGNPSPPLTFGLRYDTTDPTVAGGQAGRGPDKNGWYNSPVWIDFSGTDQLSGVRACTKTNYAGPDGGALSVQGTCTDRAGNESGPLPFGLRYDGTPPEVTSASPDRGPDAGPWYNRPVSIEYSGRDALSGVDTCTKTSYEGADGAPIDVLGTCTDMAGNLSAPFSFGLMFDATAPQIVDLAATPGDRIVALSWRTTEDAESIGVTRTPGIGHEKSTLVFGGPGTSFVDAQVENGVRYAYEVRVQDPAGNSRSETVTAVPTAPPVPLRQAAAPALGPAAVVGGSGPAAIAPARGLIAPAAGAVLRAGRRPLLRWTPVPGANYYNVQLFRGRKVLTAWTSKPQYRLKLRWRYRGRRYRLAKGEYHWMVWPGFGPRSKADYGRRIGRRAFEIRAPRR